MKNTTTTTTTTTVVPPRVSLLASESLTAAGGVLVIKTQPLITPSSLCVGHIAVDLLAGQLFANVPPPVINENDDVTIDLGNTAISCSVCLDKCYASQRTTTDACKHVFCYDCICRWSARSNTCPLCRRRFRLVRHTTTNFCRMALR